MALEDLARTVVETRRKRSPVEAPAQYTNGYIAFQLGYGFARIGRHERARDFTTDATNALASVATDPVHKYLIGAFSARIEQVLAGVASAAPLPDSLTTELAGLDRISRYKVDRLREVSRILEPFVRPDAIGAFTTRQLDARGAEFAALDKITDPVARAKEVEKLVDFARVYAGECERLVAGILDVLLATHEALAVPIFSRTWPLISTVNETRRAVLYANALVVAGHFGRTELVPELLKSLGAALRVVARPDLERVLEHSLRTLRRIGLRNEIAELLAEAEHAVPAERAGALHARLAFAGGLAFLGDFARALPIINHAHAALNEDFKAVRDASRDASRPGVMRRLELIRALALAYAQAPLDSALAGIAELAVHLRDITDSFGINSHYCLSVVHFVESLVLGIASDDLALGETGRRFIEDDEHLIRRRLLRDLRTS